jgi:hypothetical protein
VEIVGYITTVIVVLFVCGTGITTLPRLFRTKRKSPKLAGTAIPETGEGLDISKRYDIRYSAGDFGSQFSELFLNVKIIGYIGQDDDESVSKMYVRGRWLVVGFADGRRAYLLPRSIISLQESLPAVASTSTGRVIRGGLPGE